MTMNWNGPESERYEQTIASKIPGYHRLYELTARLVEAALGETSEEAKLLAIGAGGGQELLALGGSYPKRTFTAVDPSMLMLNMARRRVQSDGIDAAIEWVHGEVQNVPPSEKYAGATCMLALHFVKGRSAKLALLQAAADRLEDGAPLCLACINGDLSSTATRIQLKAWREHMRRNGISEEAWKQFEGSLGVESEIIPYGELEALLVEAGFIGVTRYFGSFLIDGVLALKQEGGQQ